MTNKHTPFDLSRRTLLKGAALGSVSATLGLSLSVGASESAHCASTSIEESPFRTPPTHAPKNQGIFQVSDEQGMYYWDTGGKGPVIVLLHPGRGSAYSWPYQQKPLAEAGFRVIAYSRRGHQGSPIKTINNPSTDADDLNALLNHLNVDKCHLVALAAGGFVLSDFVVSFPEKVLSQTYACSLFGLWDKNIDARNDFILPKEFAALPPEFKELGPSYRFAHPEGVKAWVEMESKAKEKGLRNRQKDKSQVTWQKLRQLNLPTFLMAGGADLYQPPSMLRAAARELGRCETLVVPEAGHAVQWEAPDVFNNAIVQFIRKHS